LGFAGSVFAARAGLVLDGGFLDVFLDGVFLGAGLRMILAMIGVY
jgi:hypothetical protein